LESDQVLFLWDVHKPGWRKRGRLTDLTLGSKLRHEIAECAIPITELPRYLGQRAMVEKDGSEGLEASVERRGGMSEEVVAAGVVHGVSSRIVTGFFHDSTLRGDAISH
jgi:hypothetical protein